MGDLDSEDDVFSSNPLMGYMSKRTTWSDASVLDNKASSKYLVYMAVYSPQVSQGTVFNDVQSHLYHDWLTSFWGKNKITS